MIKILFLIPIEKIKDQSIISLSSVGDLCLLTMWQASDRNAYTEIKYVPHLLCILKTTTNLHQ